MDENMDPCWKSTWPNGVSSQLLGIFATAWGCQLKTLGEDTAAAYSTFVVLTVYSRIKLNVSCFVACASYCCF